MIPDFPLDRYNFMVKLVNSNYPSKLPLPFAYSATKPIALLLSRLDCVASPCGIQATASARLARQLKRSALGSVLMENLG
jgi:hypothetical protein